MIHLSTTNFKLIALLLHERNFAVLRSGLTEKIAAVCSKAKFHIEPRSCSLREAFTRKLFNMHYQLNYYLSLNTHIKLTVGARFPLRGTYTTCAKFRCMHAA